MLGLNLKKNRNMVKENANVTLKTDIQGKVATLTLNRPAQMNTIDLDMARALYEISLSLMDHSRVRALVITGAGEKAFCAGGDLAAFEKHREAVGTHLHEVTHYLHGAISRFARMSQPIITAVNGVTAGGGLAFLGFPQLVLASDSARFVSAYTKAGLSPDGHQLGIAASNWCQADAGIHFHEQNVNG